MRKYYNIELSPADAGKLKERLKADGVYYEASAAGELIHIQALLTPEEAQQINIFLEAI